MSNLPPGCSVSDIPGNGPEDMAAEAQAEAVWDVLTKFMPGIEDTEENMNLVDALCDLLNQARREGYEAAQSDAALMAHEDAMALEK